MAVLHLLGSGAPFPNARRTMTMLAFESGGSAVAVDCGGDLAHGLAAAGIGVDRVDALVLTHEHPDHVGAFPLFMELAWLGGRRNPIDVYGIAPAVTQARRCFDAFESGGWKSEPPVRWHEVEHREGAVVLQDERWRVTAAPGTHSVPVIGLRVEDRTGGGAAAYSCDTEPSEAIERLARGVGVLVHEATGEGKGHTSMQDAARIARRAGVGRLVLAHLPPEVVDADLDEARGIFPSTELGEDGGRYGF
jgi:ribonuclease Z